jgi:peptidoglycan/xylan/chitin deacetylase (PgdA/CDA1 family)
LPPGGESHYAIVVHKIFFRDAQPISRLLRYWAMITSSRHSVPAKFALRGAAIVAACAAVAFATGAAARDRVVARSTPAAQEIHQRLALAEGEKSVALTLDACGGQFDADVINTLVELRVHATIFVTRKWINRNPVGIKALRAHPDLFDIEDHGAEHVPAVVGAGKRVYGIAGATDVAHLRDEVDGGAAAIERAGAPRPQWYRGATAVYDQTAMKAIAEAGYRIAGFSVNADAGATLPRREIVARLTRVQAGDIIIAHMNKPASDSAEAIRDALPRLIAQGFRFVKLRDRAIETIR